MDELYAYMNQDRIESMLAHYRGVTEEYVWRMPDRLYVPITHEQYEEVLESIWPEIDEDYDYYWESYHNPMPFYIGTPSLQMECPAAWDTSYNFNAEDISYTVEAGPGLSVPADGLPGRTRRPAPDPNGRPRRGPVFHPGAGHQRLRLHPGRL